MKKTIFLMTSLFLSLIIITLFLTGASPRPPLGLAFTCLLMLAVVIDQFFHAMRSDDKKKDEQRSRIFLWIIGILLMVSVLQLAFWRMSYDKEYDEEELAEVDLDLRSSETYYDIVDTLAVVKQKHEIEKIEYPFYNSDEVCELNLRELYGIIRDEWNSRRKGAKLSQRTVTLDRVGTNKFRFVGIYSSEVQPELPENQVIFGMSIPTEHPRYAIPVGIRVGFPDATSVASLGENTFYLIEGTMIYNHRYEYMETYDDLPAIDRFMACYIKVDSFRPVEAETTVVKKVAKKPPWNPTPYKEIGGAE